MVQTVFNGALHGRGEAGRFCRRLRRWLLKCADPVVTWSLNGRRLRLRLSHQLPFYRQEFPLYSANLERLARAIRRHYARLILVDVGANVGDSLALAGVQPAEPCLLIEGDAEYLRLLRENTADLPEAVCVGAMLSDQAGKMAGELISTGGTGQMVVGSTKAAAVNLETLDRIIEQYPQFRQTHLLKIDVDGYDFRVLRGGARFIQKAQPVVFFEQDPRLLEAAGEGPDEVWPWLTAAGYRAVLLYDNFGYWVGEFDLADAATLCQLNAYARQRAGCYYDVAAFAPRHAELRTGFTAAEKAFYTSLAEKGTTA